MRDHRVVGPVLVGIACSLFGATTRAGVIVVDAAAGPGAQFSAIQPAVDAAADGDMILVRPSATPYDVATIDDKSLTLVADNGTVSIASTSASAFRIANLAAGKRVVLRGLTLMNGSDFTSFTWSGLDALNDAGTVWLDSCIFQSPGAGGPGIFAGNCADVVISHCEVHGGSAYYLSIFGSIVAIFATPALHAIASNVFVHASTLAGGHGYPAVTSPAWAGAEGAQITGGTALFVGCTLIGGAGGSGNGPDQFGFCLDAAAGGSALVLSTGDPIVRLVATTLTPGAAGFAPCSAPPPPAPPIDVVTGTVIPLTGTPGDFAAPSPVRESQSIALLVNDVGGSVAFLLASANPASVLAPQFSGALHVGAPIATALLGSIPPSGNLSVPITVPSVPAGVLGVTVFVQGATCPPAAPCALTPPAAVIVLDASL